MSDKITIKHVTDDCYMVEWTWNGYADAMRCENEIEARVFARGVERGIATVRSGMTVPAFNGRVEEFKATGETK